MRHLPCVPGRSGNEVARLLAMAMVGLFVVSGFSHVAEAVPRKVKRECGSDYKRLCPNYIFGTSRMRSCMRANGNQLSWGCYEALRDHGYVRGARRR